MSSATSERTVFQSRWGFHPCSYQTFRKLKEIHKYYWASLRRYHEWQRWERKDPQNRVIRKWLRDESGRKYGFEVAGPKPEPRVCPHFMGRDRWGHCEYGGPGVRFVEAYQNARYPVAKEHVSPLKVSEAEIDEFLGKCREWFAAE